MHDLQRVLHIRDGLAIAVGIVIGAGILRTPGLIAGYLHAPWLILGVWVLGGVVAGLSTLLLAEMAAALPSAGGKYVYAKEAWGPTFGFVAGWAELIVTRGFSGAAKAVVIAEYIALLAHGGSVPVMAGAVVVAFALMHLAGIRFGRLFQNTTTAVKVFILLAIAAAGMVAGHGRGFAPVAPPASGVTSTAAAGGITLLGFALAYQAVAFAYYGWEDAAKLAEETRNPGHALPRILIGGAVAVGLLYLLMNTAFLGALTPTEMAGSKLVAEDAVARTFGNAAGTIVVVAGLLILISSLNVNFLGMPRVAFALSRDGLGPRVFRQVSGSGTPVPGLLFTAALIFVLAITGTFLWLIRFMMLVAISVDTVMLLGFFRLRRTRPELERPFRVPGHPWLPGLTIAFYLLILATIVATQPRLALGGGAMLAALVIAGAITARRAATHETAPAPMQ